MRREKLIGTKEELISNFNDEQLRIYYSLLNKYTSRDELLPVTTKEDKEIAFLENSYLVLKKFFKVEVIIALIIFSIGLMFGDFTAIEDNLKDQVAIVVKVEEK